MMRQNSKQTNRVKLAANSYKPRTVVTESVADPILAKIVKIHLDNHAMYLAPTSFRHIPDSVLRFPSFLNEFIRLTGCFFTNEVPAELCTPDLLHALKTHVPRFKGKSVSLIRQMLQDERENKIQSGLSVELSGLLNSDYALLVEDEAPNYLWQATSILKPALENTFAKRTLQQHVLSLHVNVQSIMTLDQEIDFRVQCLKEVNPEDYAKLLSEYQENADEAHYFLSSWLAGCFKNWNPLSFKSLKLVTALLDFLFEVRTQVGRKKFSIRPDCQNVVDCLWTIGKLMQDAKLDNLLKSKLGFFAYYFLSDEQKQDSKVIAEMLEFGNLANACFSEWTTKLESTYDYHYNGYSDREEVICEQYFSNTELKKKDSIKVTMLGLQSKNWTKEFTQMVITTCELLDDSILTPTDIVIPGTNQIVFKTMNNSLGSYYYDLIAYVDDNENYLKLVVLEDLKTFIQSTVCTSLIGKDAAFLLQLDNFEGFSKKEFSAIAQKCSEYAIKDKFIDVLSSSDLSFVLKLLRNCQNNPITVLDSCFTKSITAFKDFGKLEVIAFKLVPELKSSNYANLAAWQKIQALSRIVLLTLLNQKFNLTIILEGCQSTPGFRAIRNYLNEKLNWVLFDLKEEARNLTWAKITTDASLTEKSKSYEALKDISPYEGFDVNAFEELCKSAELSLIEKTSVHHTCAARLIWLFGKNNQALDSYLENFQSTTAKGIKKSKKSLVHDAAQFKLPASPLGELDKQNLASILIQSPKLRKCTHLYAMCVAKKGSPVKTIKEFEELIPFFSYANVTDETRAIADLFFKHNYSEEEFEIFTTSKSNITPKKESNIPLVEFKVGNYIAKILKPGDARALVMGHESGCCQSVFSDAHPCAISAFTHPGSGIFVVETNEGKVVCQSFIWRTNENMPNYLVIDSIESIHHLNDESFYMAVLDEAYKTLARKMKQEHNLEVLLPTGGYGLTRTYLDYLKIKHTTKAINDLVTKLKLTMPALHKNMQDKNCDYSDVDGRGLALYALAKT